MLLVTAPPGATKKPSVVATRDREAPQNLTVDIAAALTAGRYCVETTLTVGDAKKTAKQCDVPVDTGATTTIALTGIEPKRLGTDVMVGIDLPLASLDGYSRRLD